MSEEKKKASLQRISDGGITAKIWEQKGPNGSFPTVSIERVYKNEQTQEWGTSNSYSRDEALRLEKFMSEVNDQVSKWDRFFKEQYQTQQQHAEAHLTQPKQSTSPNQENGLIAQRDQALAKAKEPTPRAAPSPEIMLDR